jgi:hypothetical protein
MTVNDKFELRRSQVRSIQIIASNIKNFQCNATKCQKMGFEPTPETSWMSNIIQTVSKIQHSNRIITIFTCAHKYEFGADCIMRSFTTCTLHQILLWWWNQGLWDGLGMYHIWERWETHTKHWFEDLKEREHSEDVGIHEKIILEWILGKENGRVWTECSQLRIGTSGGLLWTQ